MPLGYILSKFFCVNLEQKENMYVLRTEVNLQNERQSIEKNMYTWTNQGLVT